MGLTSNELNSDLTDFLKEKTPMLAYQCTECTQSFNVLKDLELHKSTHTKDGKYVCLQCNKQFSGNSFYILIANLKRLLN